MGLTQIHYLKWMNNMLLHPSKLATRGTHASPQSLSTISPPLFANLKAPCSVSAGSHFCKAKSGALSCRRTYWSGTYLVHLHLFSSVLRFSYKAWSKVSCKYVFSSTCEGSSRNEVIVRHFLKFQVLQSPAFGACWWCWFGSLGLKAPDSLHCSFLWLRSPDIPKNSMSSMCPRIGFDLLCFT